MIKKALILILATFCHNSFSAETCSRIAVINYQEVLVDTNSTQKGEGLRYFLEKDLKAKEYLDRYQKGSQIRWQNSLMGSLGTGMIISSFFINSSDSNKRNILIGGAALVAVNFLISKTFETRNEENLIKSIEQYNRRNLPKIYFSPKLKDGREPTSYEVGISKSWNY